MISFLLDLRIKFFPNEFRKKYFNFIDKNLFMDLKKLNMLIWDHVKNHKLVIFEMRHKLLKMLRKADEFNKLYLKIMKHILKSVFKDNSKKSKKLKNNRNLQKHNKWTKTKKLSKTSRNYSNIH